MQGLLIFAVFVAFYALLDKVEAVAQMYMNYRLSKAQIQLQEAKEKSNKNEGEEGYYEEPRGEIGFEAHPNNMIEIEED